MKTLLNKFLPVLVKKIIHTYSATDIETLTYKYDGNKIVSESSDGGFVANYTYTGNVITKIEERVNNQFQSSREYTYVDGKVATKVWKQNYGRHKHLRIYIRFQWHRFL